MLGKQVKVHCDGSQFIAVENQRLCKPMFTKPKSYDFKTTLFDIAFNECLQNSIVVYHKEDSLCECYDDMIYNKKAFDYIKQYLLNENIDVTDKFIIKNINRRLFSIFLRVKRLKRKVNFHSRTFFWNYFVTLTRDDTKYPDYESWIHAVKYSLSKFAYRRGWKYIFVVERGAETGREHLHGLVHVPAGQMVGNFILQKTFNRKTGKVKINNVNTFFSKFGINDFEKIRYMDAETQKHILNYITKYVTKSIENFIFSRGLKDGCDLRIQDKYMFAQCNYNNLSYILSSSIDVYEFVMNEKARRYTSEFYQHLLNQKIEQLELAS